MADATDTPAEAAATAEPAKAQAAKAKGTKTKGAKGAKGAKDKKAKKGKKGESAGGLSVVGHPRAAAAVRRAKGFGGIAGFVLAALLAHHAGLSISRALERALVAGVAGYLLAWACAVTVWRQILIAQLRAVVAQRASAPPTRRTLSVPAAADGAGHETAAAPVAE